MSSGLLKKAKAIAKRVDHIEFERVDCLEFVACRWSTLDRALTPILGDMTKLRYSDRKAMAESGSLGPLDYGVVPGPLREAHVWMFWDRIVFPVVLDRWIGDRLAFLG